MTDHHQKWLDEHYDGNCPVCEKPFDAYTYQYPDAYITIDPDVESGNVCVNSTVNSNSPDPALGIYRHPEEQWGEDDGGE